MSADLETELDGVFTNLYAIWRDQDHPAFADEVRRLESVAERGSVRAAEGLAEILALPGPVHNAASAYKWYYISLSQSGYSVTFSDENNTPPHYCGPVGDFRNESMVSSLVAELGFEQVRRLDEEAAAWLASYSPQS